MLGSRGPGPSPGINFGPEVRLAHSDHCANFPWSGAFNILLGFGKLVGKTWGCVGTSRIGLGVMRRIGGRVAALAHAVSFRLDYS